MNMDWRVENVVTRKRSAVSVAMVVVLLCDQFRYVRAIAGVSLEVDMEMESFKERGRDFRV